MDAHDKTVQAVGGLSSRNCEIEKTLHEQGLRRKKEGPDKELKLRMETCRHCEYAFLSGGKTFLMCDYYLITGKLKPCSGFDCVKKGVFRKRSRDEGRRESFDKLWMPIGKQN